MKLQFSAEDAADLFNGLPLEEMDLWDESWPEPAEMTDKQCAAILRSIADALEHG